MISLRFKALEKNRGQRLDAFLYDQFQDRSELKLPKAFDSILVSKSLIRKWIVSGCVYLNRKRVRIASKALLPNAQIEILIDPKKLGESTRLTQVVELTEDQILFEDEVLIAVNKPPGLPTQATLDNARDHLFASVKRYLSKRSQDPASYLALHHRLDRDTSGVVLFTKAKSVNAAIGEQFSKHTLEKTYLAWVKADPKLQEAQTWQVKNYLGKTGSGLKAKQSKFGSVRSGGDLAITDFKVLKNRGAISLIEAKPKTGRTHQIRIHLSEAGFPILGDALYGGRQDEKQITRMALHAAELTFKHPLSEKTITVSAPIPNDLAGLLS